MFLQAKMAYLPSNKNVKIPSINMDFSSDQNTFNILKHFVIIYILTFVVFLPTKVATSSTDISI